jgi:tungstate transport system ATP-binding protein
MAARLVLKPEVLLLDEPVASVDAKSARLIRNASLAARKEWGCTLVIVSHDRVWLAESCDYHLSIARGHIFTTGSRIPLPGACIPGPGTGRTPVLEKRDIHILTDKTAWAGVDQKIPGRITAMVFEKKRRHILTTIQVADGSVELSLPCDVTGDLGLMPGKSVILGFHTRDIQWE